MARAFEWAVGRRPEQGGSFLTVNVGSDGWNFRARDLAEAVQKVIPGVEVSTNPDAPPDRRSYRVDFSLFRSLAPGHQPEADLIGTVTELEQSLRRMGFTDRTFSTSAYVRLKRAVVIARAPVARRGSLLGKDGPALQWVRDRDVGQPPVTFVELAISGLLLIEMEPLQAEEGFTAATSFSRSEFARHSLEPRVVQCSVSFNHRRGTLRGMHYQVEPSPEAKLVRCTRVQSMTS